MKAITVITLLCIFFLINPTTLFAEEPSPAPAPIPQVQWTNNFTVEDKPSTIITVIQDFISGFDSILGGFIFYTPDPFGATIKLKDSTEITGVTKYRDIFYQIAIPLSAIAIAIIAITRIGSDNLHELKSFGGRFLLTIVLFITVPYILSYSIQFNNLLVDRISTTQQFTGFLNDYLDESQTKIQEGNQPEKYGIPSYDVSMVGGVFKSFGKFIVQTFLFILTFLFLLGGFIYLGFQFVIRFATLLFLAVLYPVVLPFALAEKTHHVVSTFFKTWFTFLLQQPAFVLGFAIANDIFTSILSSQGPTVGMLFFYTGFLFFLGGVNILVGRIFGDTWGTFATNMQAAIASRAVTSPISNPIKSSVSGFQRGLTEGHTSYDAGKFVRDKLGKKKGGDKPSSEDQEGSGFSNKEKASTKESASSSRSYNINPVTRFSRVLSDKGFSVNNENQKQGVITVTGDAYKYEDPKSNLVSYYPTALEGVQDGVSAEKLEPVHLEQERFIDLSSFNKSKPNPHHYNAMQEAQKRGEPINYAHITKSSPPEKVRNFLDVSEKRNNAFGIKGVIIERHGKDTADPVVRFYSYNNNEKRKNI